MKIITTVVIIILVYLLILFERRMNIKKLHTKIREQFGKKPIKRKYKWKNIGYHWKEYKNTISKDEKIDNITWNDLEMDKVFSRINNCNSFVGEQILYSILHCLPKNSKNRDSLERKVSFFTNNDGEREKIQFLLAGLGKDSRAYYLPKFMNNLDSHKISGITIYRIMQILLVLSVLPAIIFQNLNFLFITVAIFAINMAIYAIGKFKYEVNMDMLKGIIGVITISTKIANTKKLSYGDEFVSLGRKAKTFKKLSKKIGLIQMKKEASYTGDILGLLYDYLIGATLWDFTSYHRILKTLRFRQDEFMDLYKMIGEVDMAITIASFRKSLPLYCTPKFTENKGLYMKKIYHPLIDEPVCNTIALNNSCIITGSNASGKSTYIKAVAINVILAQNINTCMAEELTLPHGQVITSMAVRDDLMSGESYYIKEIKYLKRIIENLSKDRLVICAIDEILRGTNTEERIAASAAILRFLHKKNCIVIVASHDIELTQILNNIYDNYHFTEQMKEEDITFDYKIYQGASNSKNAIKLLKHIGFPEEIITEAQKRA
ncbi:MutS-related protein [Dethiothermospora halolimnae]|uniref:MutS-related protein n=1 Tax=Dethiothermospora halolimnae TaxID=3114390 RepID=UPI003CCC0ED9